MDEELYDPDCSACERAQEDYAALERVADDLAVLVQRLVRCLRKAAPDSELPDQATDYLRRKSLQGSPLRDERACSTAAPVPHPERSAGDERMITEPWEAVVEVSDGGI